MLMGDDLWPFECDPVTLQRLGAGQVTMLDGFARRMAGDMAWFAPLKDGSSSQDVLTNLFCDPQVLRTAADMGGLVVARQARWWSGQPSSKQEYIVGFAVAEPGITLNRVSKPRGHGTNTGGAHVSSSRVPAERPSAVDTVRVFGAVDLDSMGACNEPNLAPRLLDVLLKGLETVPDDAVLLGGVLVRASVLGNDTHNHGAGIVAVSGQVNGLLDGDHDRAFFSQPNGLVGGARRLL